MNPKAPVAEAVSAVQALGLKHFHVPGHGGSSVCPDGLGEAVYRLDLSELDGLDVLSEPSGCIAEAERLAAEGVGARDSFMLINGASVGVMAAMLAAFRPGDKILLPRNVHRSVISGLIHGGYEPVWFLPELFPDWGLWGPVTPEAVRHALDQHPDIRGLVITSPTYEGIGSDVFTIGALCRDRHVRCIVDEAHGALWPFADWLPASACQAPVDAVIHSMHKTGGSLTQTAFAHLPYGSSIDPTHFRQALNALQTTSPSYPLMMSLDGARAFLASREGQARLARLQDQVAQLREALAKLPAFRLFDPALIPSPIPAWDPSKLYLQGNTPGDVWGVRLEKTHGLAYEAVTQAGVLYLAGLGLHDHDMDALLDALKEEPGAFHPTQVSFPLPSLPQTGLSPREAFFAPAVRIDRSSAAGRIARETVVHCPPGIAVLIPGEIIHTDHFNFLPDMLLVVE